MRKLPAIAPRAVTLSTRAPFEVPTVDNSQSVTLSDCFGRAPVATWIIGAGTRAIAYAVIAYARRHGLPLGRVQYAARPARAGEV